MKGKKTPPSPTTRKELNLLNSSLSSLQQHIVSTLDAHIPDPKIPLHFSSPYTLLIATLLSAQCTDERVNRVTEALFAHATTPHDMVQLSPETIAQIIRPCGLYQNKSKHILSLSHQLIQRHQGEAPSTREELEALDGIGRKTASVVLVQAFGVPAFPIDTHIHRCAQRWGISEWGSSILKVERDLTHFFAQSDWGRRHLQIILFARQFCPARGHRKERCPVCSKIP